MKRHTHKVHDDIFTIRTALTLAQQVPAWHKEIEAPLGSTKKSDDPYDISWTGKQSAYTGQTESYDIKVEKVTIGDNIDTRKARIEERYTLTAIPRHSQKDQKYVETTPQEHIRHIYEHARKTEATARTRMDHARGLLGAA